MQVKHGSFEKRRRPSTAVFIEAAVFFPHRNKIPEIDQSSFALVACYGRGGYVNGIFHILVCVLFFLLDRQGRK